MYINIKGVLKTRYTREVFVPPGIHIDSLQILSLNVIHILCKYAIFINAHFFYLTQNMTNNDNKRLSQTTCISSEILPQCDPLLFSMTIMHIDIISDIEGRFTHTGDFKGLSKQSMSVCVEQKISNAIMSFVYYKYEIQIIKIMFLWN